MPARECPLCGSSMQLREREVTDRMPGTALTRTTKFNEWICPDCDYFEEADGEAE